MIATSPSGKRLARSMTIAIAIAASFAGSAASTGPTRGEETRRFELRIENGRLVGGRKIVRVRRGDTVEINWTADRRSVLHLHGYDIETKLDAGTSKTMAFRAHATGRFPIERHGEGGRHAVLIYLEVHPR